MRARNLSFRRVKKTGRLDHRNDYNKKRNKVANMLKSVKLKYFKKLKSNPKHFLKVVKCLTKQTSSIPILKDNNENAIHNDAEKATLLNNFFSFCFNDAYPPINMSDYNQLSQPDQCSCPEELLCTEDEILEMLLSIDTTKSSGPDGISGILYAEINSYQHCSWNYKAHEHVNSFREISYCLENIVCCSSSEREQSYLCVKL